MSDKVFSKCGMRCDLCLVYRPNVNKEDRRENVFLKRDWNTADIAISIHARFSLLNQHMKNWFKKLMWKNSGLGKRKN